ncbi:hypothetical protein MKJ04_16660 [Pontibacter sp. E15-1]|uniref:hypothetical protein n=1 Tax=Pontibacter sp. E15-1 TaxID=2919918 RepID=UPI001F4F9FB7|nr:hypothetical protein [Pontibacter sp. E15-1]MCJ8166479.1 hypothetical protein [Pontibacter sp. E15-1]
MKNEDNFRVRKDDGDSLGEHHDKKKVTEESAPKKVDKESENTPPDHEVYVDLEPDELHLADGDVAEVAEADKKKK